MSVGEIKKEATQLQAEEVTYLAAWFHHLSRRRNAAYLKSLDEAFEATEAGDKIPLQDYQKLSKELDNSGL